MESPVRPIFVVGSPRSGTTMLGSWLASDPQTYDVGEYNAFYLAHRLVPAQMRGIQPPGWTPHLERYLAETRAHAGTFIEEAVRREGCDSYVDSSPRNLLIADELSERFPNALFVLALRHYAGVVQSLGRARWPWVPGSAEGKAGVWAESYGQVSLLPPDRTIAVSYDALGADPDETLSVVCGELAAAGVRIDQLDRTRLAFSHAHVLGQPRPTLLDGAGRLRSIPTVDPLAWTPAVHAAVAPRVMLVDATLHELFPQYIEPNGWSAPAADAGRPPLAVAPYGPEPPELVSAEFIVDDLERAEELLVDLIGLEVVQRSRHPDFDAEMVLVNSGAVTLSLLHPTDAGDRPPFPISEARLAHLTFTVDDEARFVQLRSRLVDAGVAVAHSGPHMFHLPDTFVQSVLGASPVIVIVHIPDQREPAAL